MKRGLYWRFTTIVSLSLGHIVRATHFLSIGSKHFTMSSKRREYHVDCRAKKAANFFVACDANPNTRVKIPDAMRIKGYSISEAADRSLQMQVRREADKIKAEAVPGPSAPAAAAAASALITLLNTANMGRPALQTITVPRGGRSSITTQEDAKNVASGADRAAERAEAKGSTRPGPRTCDHSRCRREGKGEGEPSHDCRGDCAGRGGVQGTGLSCDDE